MIKQTEDRATVVICTKLLQKIGHVYSFSTYMKLQMTRVIFLSSAKFWKIINNQK